MKFFAVLLMIFIQTSLPAAIFATGTESNQNLTLQKTYNIFGDAESIGNTIVWKDSAGSPTDRNNAYDMVFIDIDSDSTTFNSSSATLDLGNQGYEILYSRLYWQGHICRVSGCDNDNISSIGTDTDKFNYATALAHTIKIKGPTGSYQTLSATDMHYEAQDSDERILYSASYDVTSIVQTAGEGTYTVADLMTSEGQIDKWGALGGWALVTIYQDSSQNLTYKNISMFHGFQVVESNYIIDVPISGFLTPKTGTINSTATFFTVDGDEQGCCSTGELFQMENANNSDTLENISDALNPVGNQFNSTISNLGVDDLVRNPNHTDNLGYDLDKIDVSSFLTHKQTSTSFRFSNNGDLYNLAFILFTTELYVPKFCYDYAYKQQDIYFTEENNGSKNPKLTDINSLIGSIIPGEPIELTVFIRNLVDSDIDVTNMVVNVTDINTTQATYITDSTKLAKIGDLNPVALDDASDLNVSSDANGDQIRGITIGDMSSNDHFYVYYSLDPKDINNPLDMDINVDATYDLSIDGSTAIPYTLTIGASVPICSSANFKYAPAKGIFNVVHNNYYDLDIGGSNPYYNLPTQVTSREGNFKVISLDENNTDTLKPVSTIVGVEMIDASAFHDTNASCQEQASAISERIWVMFDNNSTSTMFDKDALTNAIGLNNTLSSSSEFYKTAKQNTAFRISYNVSNDTNEDLVKIEESGGEYKILNFPEIVQVVGACAQPVVYPLNANNNGIATQASQACGNSGNFISAAHLQACMECIYGFNTKFVCSRDNFAIRPEAFLMHLDDQNQTNPTSQSRLTTGYSGVTGAAASVVEMAADYNYNIEVNATNHLNNTSSPGYTKSFISSILSDTAQYIWEPRGLTAAQLAARNLACNDDANKSADMRFLNGVVDINSSVNQVGEYRLNILDTTWTAVDSDPTFMTHHTGSYFISSATPDCLENDSTTQNVNSGTKNGCNISSSHTNNEATLVYNDYDVTFHPYKFNITSAITMGLTNRDVNTTNDFSNFVYMANVNVANDVNMSVQVNSTITPQGYNNSSLSNFVTGCYAKPLDINISKSAPLNTNLTYRYIISDRNTTGTATGSIANVANEDANITTPNTFFAKGMNGVLDSIMNLNFDRNQNVVANPEDINYSKVTVYDPRTFINADLLTNKTAQSNISLNGSAGQNITHYFGRTAARKTRIVCDDSFPCLSGANSEPNVLIYYEAYCYGSTNGNACERTLLPTLSGRYIQKVDSRWYVNLNHTESGDGNLTATTEAGANLVTVPNITNQNTYTKDSVHSYNGNNGLPYEATMDSTIPNWLIYDENNATATTNKHVVIFQSATQWTGKHETNTTTQTQKVRRVNRRTMW